MEEKKITFDYKGGKYTQNFHIRGTNLPWTYESDSPWIAITTGATSITMEVLPIYDFNTRTGRVKIFDKFKNEIDLIVEQTGYYDLSLEMPETVVLYHDYYDKNKTYDVYFTVYGGPVQNITCKKLQSYIDKVWDNSDMYNDFVLRIPQTLKGNFNVKHSDCDSFKKFCEENGLEYPKSQLEKKIEIVQVSTDDVIGEMVIKIGDEEYTNDGVVHNLVIDSTNLTTLNVISTKFITVQSKTKYKVVTDSDIEISDTPNWVESKVCGRRITLKANSMNNFDNRITTFKVYNSQNPRQYISFKLIQKSRT